MNKSIRITLTVEVDPTAVFEDNPPEDIRSAIAFEISSHLDSKSVRGALGIVRVVVDPPVE